MRDLPALFRTALTTAVLLSVTAAVAAPETFELFGAEGELQLPGAPLTVEEAQELAQMFAGDVDLTLVYDGDEVVGNQYTSPTGDTVFEIVVRDAVGNVTFSYGLDGYFIFVDDTTVVDTLFFSPEIDQETTVTLSTGTTVGVDITLQLQDASGTALSSSDPPPTLDLVTLNFRMHTFTFLDESLIANGSVRGALRVQAPDSAECGNGVVEDGEECDDTDGCCTAACEYATDGASCSDDDPCTLGDACNATGACEGGSPPLCNAPPGDCHEPVGSCDLSGVCVYDPKAGGAPCGAGASSFCDAADTCDGAGSCQPNHAPDGTGCSDGNACTSGETCAAGACTGGSALVCDAPPGPCYQPTGTCGPSGCTYLPKSNGTPCGSGADTACDNPDSCDGAGNCNGNSAPNGTACNDGNDCSSGDVCAGGTCAGTPLVCLGQPVTICGTSGKNTLTGTPGPDVIDGRDGNDKIYGGGGDDLICGGEGWDEIFGEGGNDQMNGGGGFDRCTGGSGTDSGQSCEINNP
jgi:hypothetical protein